MEPINKLLQEISAIKFEVGAAVWVDVLHINHPQSFYVRPQAYNSYLPLLQNRGDLASGSEININGVYVFKSTTLESHVRGQVVACDKIGDVTYKMFAIDIGFTEDGVTPDRIWKTDYEPEVPPLAIHCQLGECAPVGETWEDVAISAMRTFVEGERAKMIIRTITPEYMVIDLYNSNPDDIATMLALTYHSTYGFAHGVEMSGAECSEASIPHYILRDLTVGEKLNVKLQTGNIFDTFYVIPIEDYEYYLTDRENYTTYAKSQRDVYIEDLKLNSPIGVFYHKNGKYERGVVKELIPEFNRAKVHLVDIGIKIEESVMKMKLIPKWYLRVPIRALWCTLCGSQTYSNMVASMSYPGVEFQMSIKMIGDEDISHPHIVEIAPIKLR